MAIGDPIPYVDQKHIDEIERLRAELAAEQEAHAETKAIIPNKNDTGAAPRPFENADWWSVAVVERRKRRATEKDNAVLREMQLENEAKYAATRREHDALRAALVKAGEALEIVVVSYGPLAEGTKPHVALTEIRKLTGDE